MEALGAAAAIAQFVELSFEAGKLARSVVSSFRHAPAEITELNAKLHHLHGLLTHVAIMYDELPQTQSQLPLLPDHHIGMLSAGMQRILDSLMRLKSVVTVAVGSSCGVRDRLRWATLDKKRARCLLQDAQMANDELSIMLQILTTRLASMNQNSLAALTLGQSLMIQSLEDIKDIVSMNMTQLIAAIPGHADRKRIAHTSLDRNVYPTRQEYENDPGYMLMQHNRHLTHKYLIAKFGNSERPEMSKSGFYNTWADLALETKMKSRKARFLFSLCFKLLGHHVLRFELHVQVLCRLWKLDPSLTASLSIFNVRPSDAPIFLACRSWNLQEVHYLLETGQAGINDVDDELGGLLEHVVSGHDNGYIVSETKFLNGGQVLLDYLLDQGCDPSITRVRNDKALPAVLSAFAQGFKEATSTMLSRGADIVSFGNKVGGLFEGSGTNTSQLVWKFRLLQSMQYADWQLDGPANNLLYGACWSSNTDVSLFALEIARIDPNQPGSLNRKPIGNAAQTKWIEGITILLQYGAYINVSQGAWNGPPLRRSMSLSHIMTDTSHFLLLKGADPRLEDSAGLSAWGYLMSQQYDPELSWCLKFRYLAFEGSVAHLLHHGADPFEVFISDYDIFAGPHYVTWFTQMGHIQASDIARFRSYGISRRRGRFESVHAFRDGLPEDLVQQLETFDRSRSFGWTFEWNEDGQVSWNQSRSSSGPVETAGSGSYVDEEEPGSGFSPVSTRACSGDSDSDSDASDEYITPEGNFVPIWEYANSRTPHPEDPFLPFQLSSRFFRNATNFYRHSTTVQGQRQLSRWPMVRALCDGLQHAGYRVEMDDDGDLWYDCDDGDRYFDAWETQPAEDRDDWLVDVCPICQNFKEYGLGHVLDIEEEAIEKVQEYRRQVREGKRRYF